MARVLVVDDEPDVLLLCRVNLQHAGHEVFEAGDGALAIELARRELPDAIVLDLMLPQVGGYDVLDALRSDEATREIPVCVLTAKAQLEDKIRCWQEGASEFMTKPFSPAALTETLETLIAMDPQERRERREATVRKLLEEPVWR
ncbi:MAG TPA: response regulator [Actinomycetota bacterium]|jgi:DNA-binding response OmpR family regulator